VVGARSLRIAIVFALLPPRVSRRRSRTSRQQYRCHHQFKAAATRPVVTHLRFGRGRERAVEVLVAALGPRADDLALAKLELDAVDVDPVRRRAP
jgi:hypothetical protein